ncbi:hypothetical protein D3C81_1343130 [compost metagenome]
MRLEGVQVAGGDHAGHLDTQGRQLIRCSTDDLDLGFLDLESAKVFLELGPAGNQLLAAPGHRAVFHVHEVVAGAVRADKDDALSAADQQLLLKLPVVMRLQLAGQHCGSQGGVPQLVFEQGVAQHRGAVHRGQQVAAGTDDGVKLFADHFLDQGAGQLFGSVATVEDGLLLGSHLRHDAGLLQRQQVVAGLVLRSAHHRGRLRSGEVAGAKGMPLRRALLDVMHLHRWLLLQWQPGRGYAPSALR